VLTVNYCLDREDVPPLILVPRSQFMFLFYFFSIHLIHHFDNKINSWDKYFLKLLPLLTWIKKYIYFNECLTLLKRFSNYQTAWLCGCRSTIFLSFYAVTVNYWNRLEILVLQIFFFFLMSDTGYCMTIEPTNIGSYYGRSGNGINFS